MINSGGKEESMAIGTSVTEEVNERKTADYIYMVSGRVLIISMAAELDHHLAEEMRGVIDEIIDERGVNNIIFDFSKIEFMDSAGIGLIMGRYKKIMENGSIYVAGINDSIQRIMLISGLHKLVVCCDDTNDALMRIRERGGM